MTMKTREGEYGFDAPYVPALMLLGSVTGGWHLARAALIAHQRLAAGSTGSEAELYKAKIITARFYAEPKSTAVNLFEAYQVAFRICEQNNTGGAYATAPSDATARTECTNWERKMWSRTPTPA